MIDYSTYKMSKRELAKALCFSLGLVYGVTYLFYKNLIISLLFTPVTIWLLKREKNRLKEKRLEEMNVQFKEALQSISAALNAGYSIENALFEAEKDVRLLYEEDAYIVNELRYMLYELQLNKTIEEIFLEFSERVPLEDVTNFVDVFITAKRTGGDIIKIISATSKNMNDKLEVKRQIQTVITSKKFETNIMSLIPMGIILYMWLSSPGFMDPLYNNLLGIIIMSVMLVIYAAAYLLSVHLTKIEV